MTTVTLLEKARQRRLNALAARGERNSSRYDDNILSIFDNAFDGRTDATRLSARNNVIAFRSSRTQLVAANEQAAPERIAA